jgi:hypothetical protein
MLSVKQLTKTIAFYFLISTSLFAQSNNKNEVPVKNWYEKSFYLFHLDYHSKEADSVGRDANFAETLRLLNLSKPDVIQVHAKGNPGWTSYPSKVGYTPPKLVNDVMQIWKNVADSAGYVFSAYYNLGRDGVIMNKRPEWNRIDAKGVLTDKALCYNSGVVEGYLLPMIGEIMEKYNPAGFWFDGSCFTITNCYCGKCTQRFKKESGLDAPRKPEEKGWDAYKDMQRQIYRELIASTSDYIKKRNKNCLVAINLANSLRMPEQIYKGLDYLTCDLGVEVDNIPVEACWYDGRGKPFDIMTSINYSLSGTKYLKPKEQLEQEMAAVISNGGRYFAWDNPTPEAGLTPRRYEMLGEVVAPFLRSRQDFCMDSKRVPDVSLFHGAASHYAATRDLTQAFTIKNPQFYGSNISLRQLHLCQEMVSDAQLDALDIKGKLLIVENPSVLTPTNKTALFQYVKNGGQVLMTGAAVFLPELNALTGIEQRKKDESVSTISINADGQLFSFASQIPDVKRTKAKVVSTGIDEKGIKKALLFKNKYGKGAVFSVPFPLFTTNDNNTIPLAVKDWYMQQIFPNSKRLFTSDADFTTEVVVRQLNKKQIIHFVNMATGERKPADKNSYMKYSRLSNIPPVKSFNFTLNTATRPTSVMLQPQNKEIKDFKYSNGKLSLTIPNFDIHQIVVVE